MWQTRHRPRVHRYAILPLPQQFATHAIPWRFIHEDPPNPGNRVVLERDGISLRYRQGNKESYQSVAKRWISFFPSSAAFNPALTIMANALRVGDHLLDRIK
jgi:hypothetical protein